LLVDLGSFASGHEIDQLHRATVGDHARAQHQAIVFIGAFGAEVGSRRQHPLPVLFLAQQRRENRIRIEAWQTQPVNSAAAVDQSRAVAVAQHGVILDTHGHRMGARFRRKSRQLCMRHVGIRL